MKRFLTLALAAIMIMCCLAGCGTKKDTVMTVDGAEVSWDEFMYWLSIEQEQLIAYYNNYAGTSDIDWDGEFVFYNGVTNAEWCVNTAVDDITRAKTIENKAKELGIELDDKDNETIDQNVSYMISQYMGEDATEEDFDKFLSENYHTSLDYQRQSMGIELLYNKLYANAYGEDSEKFDDADAIAAYAEENGYISANHILFMTIDPATGGPLSDKEIAEKEAQANEIAEQLQAITDKDELLAKFAELKEEYDEDTGKTTYPNGYCFTNGDMVDEFYQAALELEPYTVSAPVQSDYGFHVIMRVDNDFDNYMSSHGASLRGMAARDAFVNNDFAKWTKDADASFVGSFKNYDFTQFFSTDGFNFVEFDKRP